MKYLLTVLLLAAALPLAAKDPKEPTKPPDFNGNATMCNGTYALCIKAQCEPDVSANNQVRCKCVIEKGWSMGPNSCVDRKANLTSTYSNRLNHGSKVLSCPDKINWAWCYGASCEKDPNDPTGKTAICRCPVVNSKAVILVDANECSDNTPCSQMWSAARPAESKFANDYYWWYMKKYKKGHAEPPAKGCPAQ